MRNSKTSPGPQPARAVHVAVIGLRGVPDVQGGIETHVQNLYPLIVGDGVTATIYARAQFVEPDAPRQWRSMDVVPLWAPRRAGVEALVHSLLAMLHARFCGADLLHVHGIGPALVTPLARLLGLRTIVTHHGKDYDREKWGWFARFLLRSGERVACRFANRVICVSQADRDRLAAIHGDARIVRISNGASRMAPPTGSAVLHELGLQPGRYVLNVARMVPEKRQLDLVRAFARHAGKGWKLVLVGSAQHDSTYPSKVAQACRETGDCVLAGVRTGADLSTLYANAGVFVLPSAHEGLPITLLEALSFGLPCIASDIGANLEVRLPATQYFPVLDTDVLAARLAGIIDAPAPAAAPARQQSTDRLPLEFRWESAAAATRSLICSVLRIGDARRDPALHDTAARAAAGRGRSIRAGIDADPSAAGHTPAHEPADLERRGPRPEIATFS